MEGPAVSEQSSGISTDAADIPNVAAQSPNGMIPGMAAPVVNDIAAAREDVVNSRENVVIDSERLTGSINLTGLRFDDLSLKDYRETVDPTSPIVTLLNPSNTPKAYFAEFGWISEAKIPGRDTVWTASQSTLAENETIRFTWDNGEGLLFIRDVALDEKLYVFHYAKYSKTIVMSLL